MGLGEWFDGFCKNIAVKDGGTISARYRLLTKRLNTEFWNTDSESSHSLYIGSYGRNTAISGFSDLDMSFELPSSIYKQYDQHAGNGQSALLQALKNAIAKTYSTSSVGGDGQVVVTSFTDGLTFEILPAFVNNTGGYNYPNANSGGSWKSTNPKAEMAAFSQRNKDSNYNLVLLCRMMRSWKAKWDVPISGMLIDTLAYQFIEGWQYRDKSYYFYDYMCRDFFRYMADQNDKQTYWRAPGSADYVATKGNFQYKATRCHNISLEAIQYEQAKPSKEWSAKDKWRDIFGTAFPD